MKTIFSKTINVSDYKPIYKDNGKWYVCFWYKEIMKQVLRKFNGKRYVKTDELVSSGMCSYSYFIYDSKPSVQTIKNDINAYVNSIVSDKIVNGFVWKGNSIHLTAENQMNYKSSYDLALQSGGANLPIRIKTTKNGKTEYLVFMTIDELSAFYLAMNKHINKMLENGWDMKDNIDYSVYNA